MKKIVFSSFFIFTYLFSFCQSKSFNLRINIKNLGSNEIEVKIYGENQKVIKNVKTTKLNDSSYLATGKLDYPSIARIVVKNKRVSSPFFLDFGTQLINTHFDSLRYLIKVSGSNINDEYVNKYLPLLLEYKENDNAWWLSYNKLKEKYSENVPLSIEDSMQALKVRNSQIRDFIISKYVISNSKSYLSFWILHQNFELYNYSKAYDTSFSYLNKKIQKSLDGEKMKKRLKNSQQIDIGNYFPKIELVDTIKNKVIIGDNFPKFTLIDFWFSNCGPCIAEFEELNEIFSTYSKSGFEIIGISIDKLQNEEKWKKAIQKYKLQWTNLWDMDGKVASKYSIHVFPTNFLLDETGKIIQKNIYPPQLKSFLSKYLK